MQENNSVSAIKVKKPKKEKKPGKFARFFSNNKRDCIILIVCALLAIAVWGVATFALGHSEDIKTIGDEVFPEDVFYLFGNESFPISQSIISGWITIGVITVVALLIRIFVVRKMTFVPGKIQFGVEYLVTFFDNMSKKNAHSGSSLGPVILSFAAFICIGTLLELFGIRPPNADLNTCIAMALMAFYLINMYGFRKKKLRRFKRYLPNVINIISDIAVPVSMTFRLYGSILSGTILMSMIYMVLSPVVPSFIAVLATLMHAFIQAFIFATLTSIFVGEAVE